MERKNLESYLSKSNVELLSDFGWGVQGQNDFGQFMNLVREQQKEKGQKVKRRIPNGTIVTEIKTGRKLQILGAVLIENEYVYHFFGKSKEFTLSREEIKPNGW